MSLYSDDVKRIVKSYDWPPGNRLELDFIDGIDDVGGTEFLWVIMYRDNFAQFDGVEQLRIAKIMNDLIPRLITSGVPTRLKVERGTRPHGG